MSGNDISKPRLLFVFDHKYEDRWMDGLYAALEILEEDFEIAKCNLYKDPLRGGDYAFVLGWGAFGSTVDKALQQWKGAIGAPVGLCIAGNAFPPNGALNYDVLFYETKWYRDQINFHPNIVHAFGVNTQIYNKDPIQPLGTDLQFATPVVWDYIGVGSLSTWKRWEKMADKKGTKLVIGEYQVNNENESGAITKYLVANGVMVSDMVHPLDLANYYRWSRICYIPADINGGGERAILEAKACGLRVEFEEDNPKLRELAEGPILTEVDYAKALKKGILSCLD